MLVMYIILTFRFVTFGGSSAIPPIDIEELEKNKEKVEQDHINIFVNKEHEKYKEIIWKWANPSILPKT